MSASEWAIYSVFIVENLILAAVMAWLAVRRAASRGQQVLPLQITYNQGGKPQVHYNEAGTQQIGYTKGDKGDKVGRCRLTLSNPS